MVFRLVLMGAVAGMGLSLPSRADVEGWGRRARTWVEAAVGLVDPGGAADDGRPAAAPEAVTVTDEEFAAVLDEVVGRFAEDAAEDETSEAAGAVETARADAGTDGSFDAAMDQVVSEFATDLAATAAARNDREFDAVVDGMASAFAEDAKALAARAEEDRPVLAGPATVEVAAAPAPAPAPAAATSDKSETPAPGLARPEDRLTNAVRLTRDAVFAWARLLHGPAVVTIAR
jgi:hypothetical protein